jgi:hypothetical protein
LTPGQGCESELDEVDDDDADEEDEEDEDRVFSFLSRKINIIITHAD